MPRTLAVLTCPRRLLCNPCHISLNAVEAFAPINYFFVAHSFYPLARCAPYAPERLVGVAVPDEPSFISPSSAGRRPPSDRTSDDDCDAANRGSELQHTAPSQPCTTTLAAPAAHLLAARESACSILELVMPHKETAKATGDERKIVTAFTSGVLKSQIFTGKRCASVAEGRRAGRDWHAGLTVKAVRLTGIALVDNVAVGTPVGAQSVRVLGRHPCSSVNICMVGAGDCIHAQAFMMANAAL